MDAFSGVNLQDALTVLSTMDAGATVAEAMAEIRSELAKRAPAEALTRRPISKQKPAEMCPSCGRHALADWAVSSLLVGARVMGCKVCHYSRIEE